MAAEIDGAVCPLCESRVDDFEPGVSAVRVDGVLMHPSCAIREGIAIGEADDHAANNPEEG